MGAETPPADGDLRDRMAAALRAHHIDLTQVDRAQEADRCVCGQLVDDWDAHWIDVDLAVRDDELERLRGELAEARRDREALYESRKEIFHALGQANERAEQAEAALEEARQLLVTVHAAYEVDEVADALAALDAPSGADSPDQAAPEKVVIVGSRTHELRVFAGSTEDAREFAAGLVEQLRDQGPESRNPYVPSPTSWTPENWRDAKDDSASRFRRGVTSCAWYGPAGLEIRIEDAS